MKDLISRQAAIDLFLAKGMITAAIYVERMPAAQPEPLTDKEKRIFLAAMGREERVCKQIDKESEYVIVPDEDSLVAICHKIVRKVKGALWT